MSYHDLRLILILLLLTFGIQGASAHIPPTLLQAARAVQVLLGVAIIYLLAVSILHPAAIGCG